MTIAKMYLMRIETAYCYIENAHKDAASYYDMYRDGCITRDELARLLAMHADALVYYHARLSIHFSILADYL